MTSQLVTEPFALEVLVIQAERIAKQARNLRFAIEEHGKSAHLQAAQSYTQSAELLANYVAASIKCEIADREKLAHALAAEDIKQAADAWIPFYGDDGTGWRMFFAVEVRHG